MTLHVMKPPQQLTGWKRVQEISEALGISSQTVYSDTAVARSRKATEWVQKRYVPALGRVCWFIDTDSVAFMALANRWQQSPLAVAPQSMVDRDVADMDDWPEVEDSTPDTLLTDAHDVFLEETNGDTPERDDSSSTSMSSSEKYRQERALNPWPVLCRSLSILGLEVYTNSLEQDGRFPVWHWRWGEQSGVSYLSQVDALLDALSAKLKSSSSACVIPYSLDDTPVMVLPTKKKGQWFRFILARFSLR